MEIIGRMDVGMVASVHGAITVYTPLVALACRTGIVAILIYLQLVELRVLLLCQVLRVLAFLVAVVSPSTKFVHELLHLIVTL
jgi:hypothetical protein